MKRYSHRKLMGLDSKIFPVGILGFSFLVAAFVSMRVAAWVYTLVSTKLGIDNDEYLLSSYSTPDCHKNARHIL